jgi:DNA-binding transcriptional MerR regulator
MKKTPKKPTGKKASKPTDQAPTKLYFTISEAAKMTGIKAHVLRYWESEFPTLKPRKTRSGSRRYRQQDIDEIEAIKKLLYEEGYRITGARKMLRETRKTERRSEEQAAPQIALPFAKMAPEAQLAHVREQLQEVLRLLKDLKEETAAPEKR